MTQNVSEIDFIHEVSDTNSPLYKDVSKSGLPCHKKYHHFGGIFYWSFTLDVIRTFSDDDLLAIEEDKHILKLGKEL